ncbi:MAG TPA: hypothetical protein VH593_06785 [Ktedonobacteraceae bacterium]|jgi:hypothetical protein
MKIAAFLFAAILVGLGLVCWLAAGNAPIAMGILFLAGWIFGALYE